MAKAEKSSKDAQAQQPGLPMFYKKPMPLSATEHGDKSLKKEFGFEFAKNVNSVPLNAVEFALAAKYYPIVFTADAMPVPVAILGMQPGQNLFVDKKGNWTDGIYIPSYIRRYPFIFTKHPKEDNFVLCIDEESGLITKGKDRPFFGKDGKPTDLTNTALKFCSEFHGQYGLTSEFCKALAAAKILESKSAQARTDEKSEPITLSGFNMISEEKLNALPDATINEWRKKGWLGLIYSALLSNGNWRDLISALRKA